MERRPDSSPSAKKPDHFSEGHKILEHLTEKDDLDEDEKEQVNDVATPTLEDKMISEHRPPLNQIDRNAEGYSLGKQSSAHHSGTEAPGIRRQQSPSSLDLSVDDAHKLKRKPTQVYNNPSTPSSHTDIDHEEAPRSSTKNSFGRTGRRTPWTVETSKPAVEPQDFEDPICDAFWKNIWCASAVHNVCSTPFYYCPNISMVADMFLIQTEIYRRVFHAVPDDQIATWKQYKEFVSHHDRLNRPVSYPPQERPLSSDHPIDSR